MVGHKYGPRGLPDFASLRRYLGQLLEIKVNPNPPKCYKRLQEESRKCTKSDLNVVEGASSNEHKISAHVAIPKWRAVGAQCFVVWEVPSLNSVEEFLFCTLPFLRG